ncbi:ABC transporter permease [Nonomuraea guangzhouensis]|uniref:Transport permease protein n=1 Tax=Nonomuraea guangzhouensis TaxID=1291555 RepID=A0ABW4G8U8_9ACTN|nr:ABC transporter permease [Nonomuraea guangzhouensis]
MTASASLTPSSRLLHRLLWEARAAHVVWRRELLHSVRNPARLLMALVQPVVYLLVFGIGFAAMLPIHGGYLTYLFPGVLMMTVQAPAIAIGSSIAVDREAGFLREMLVAPVHRVSLLAGRCAGGSTVATFQGVLVLGLAGVAHIPYTPELMIELVAEMALLAFTMTAFVTLLAVVIAPAPTFHAVIGFTLTPMTFLSGALFPMGGLPGWLTALMVANPLTYVVDLLRRTIAPYLAPQEPAAVHSPVLMELTVTAAVGLLSLLLAARRLSRPR